MLNCLRKGFDDAVKNKVTDYMIYYSGHGDSQTGEWLVYLEKPCINFEDERISIQEIFQIMYESKYAGTV